MLHRMRFNACDSGMALISINTMQGTLPCYYKAANVAGADD